MFRDGKMCVGVNVILIIYELVVILFFSTRIVEFDATNHNMYHNRNVMYTFFVSQKLHQFLIIIIITLA